MSRDNGRPTLRSVRQKLRLSQNDLARRAGLAVVTVQRLDRRAVRPTLDTLEALRGVLGADPDWEQIDWSIDEEKILPEKRRRREKKAEAEGA